MAHPERARPKEKDKSIVWTLLGGFAVAAAGIMGLDILGGVFRKN